MKRLLLTGATGFLGTNCLQRLIDQEYEIHAVARTRPAPNSYRNITWHEADLLDYGKSSALVEKVRPTHLLHLAWYVEPGKCWSSLENFRWVQASLKLLQDFHLYGGERAVMAGTCAEYDWRYGYCSENVTPLNPQGLYGTCKHVLQTLLSAFSKETGLSTCWGRIFYVYGPYEHPDRLVPLVIRSLLNGKHAECSHGNQIRDYLHIQDVANAFRLLLKSNIEGPVNIASGIPITLKEIVLSIAGMLNGEDLVKFGVIPVKQDDPSLLVGDASRLSKEVDWKPEYDLDRGLNATINWWKDQLNQQTT